MYTLTVTTHTGYKKEMRIIETDYMLWCFKVFIQATDAHHIIVIDSITGEICWEWEDGEYLIANGAVLR